MGERFDMEKGVLAGKYVSESVRHLGELCGVFENEEARAAMDQDKIVYYVQSHMVVPEGTEGALFLGISNVMPGQVDGEYFMTKGHFHLCRDRAEYYWCMAGEGALLLMDEEGCCRMEKMERGSLHYIPARVAHRLVNTGREILQVGACWPSDAGHDYASIAEKGFTARLREVDKRPVLFRVQR